MRYRRSVCGLLALTVAFTPTVHAAASTSTIEMPTAEEPVPTVTATAAVEAGTTEAGEEQPEIIVTRDNGDLPPDCGPRAVAGLLLRFVDTWNHGDQAQLAQFIASRSGIPLEGFQWFSVTEGDPNTDGRNFVTYQPEGVLEYAAERHAQREWLRLLAVDVGAGGNIGFSLTRQADDLQPEQESFMRGKGAIDCDAGRVRVWSMGTDSHGDPPVLPLSPCPEPAASTTAPVVVACTRSGSSLLKCPLRPLTSELVRA